MDTLKENVNHSRLYHFTDAKTALKIIQDDTLLVGGNYVFNKDKGKCICLSRSFNFIKNRINKGSVIFVLNKDLLQTKYKIIPISDTKNMTNKIARFTKDSKAEELIFNNITNLHKYIDKILVTDEVYDIYKKRIPEINITKISDYKINEDVNMDNNINRQKGLQIYYWLEDKGLDVDYSDWGDIFYYTFENRNDYENAIYLLEAYCGRKAVTNTDDNRLEITVDVASAYTKLKDNVNNESVDESINEGKEDAKFTVKLYTDTNKWNSEVVSNLKLGKNKQALLAYKEVMNDVVSLPIQTLYDRNIVKQLQSTVKKIVEIKWNIGKIQYRIVCKREDSNLYLLVPFIKSNTDKDTDKAVATAIKRLKLIGEGVSSAKSLDINLLNNLIDELIKEVDNDDQITENLLESDDVEDDLEDIIRDTIEENKNENSKIRLFEITTEPENPTRKKDEEKMYVVDFDDNKVDFRKLTIYPHEETEDGANKPVVSFMLSGGLNGSGTWVNYLDDLQKLLEVLKEKTGLEPLIYEESTDIADDVWSAKIFMYDHNEEDFPLDEGLFNAEKEKKSYIQKEEDGTYSLHSLTKWDDDNDFFVFNGNYPSLDDLYSSKPWTKGLEIKEEKINEDLFNPTYTLHIGDVITTPKNYHNTKNNFSSDYVLADDTIYEVIQLEDGKYTLQYQDLSYPNASGSSGILSDYDGIEYNSLEELTNAYSKELSRNSYMINRENPYESYEINYSKDLEKLIDFWNDNAVANFKVEWLNEYQIKTIDTYSNDKTPYIWQVNKDNNVLTVIDADTNKLVNRWDSVDAYIDEYHELNGDYDDDLDEQLIDETYTKDELKKLKNKVFNQRKIMYIYRKKKYGAKRLWARTKCVNCGREKKVFLSNLLKDPKKYGSCVCSDTNIDSRMDTITGLYRGTKKLRSNTSGYTGVYWVARYRGEPYNKWRAYIEIDGHRNYLGDFNSKSKAIRARKAAAKKGLKWYNDNKNEFMATSRRKRQKNRKRKMNRKTK